MPVKSCPDCAAPATLGNRGNGKCANCHGTGSTATIVTNISDGDPSCRKCGGTGVCQPCAGQGVVSAQAVKRPNAGAELNPFDDKEALRLPCPKCGDTDWFEWRFLGKLRDPVCGHQWYADSATYAGKQIRASFLMGRKMVKYFNHGIAGDGAWIAKVIGGLTGITVGLAIRLPYGLIMIPIQAIVRHNHRGANNGSNSDSEKRKSATAG